MTVCNRCGKENQDHYKFCLGCGAELSAAPKPGGDMGMMKTMMQDPNAHPPMGGAGRASPVPAAPMGGAAARPSSMGMGGPAMQPAPMGPPPGVPGFGAGGFAPQATPSGARRCPSCNSDVPPSFRFCGSCGFRMDEASAPMQVPQQQPARQAQPQRTLRRIDSESPGRNLWLVAGVVCEGA